VSVAVTLKLNDAGALNAALLVGFVICRRAEC